MKYPLSRGERFQDARSVYNQHGPETIKMVAAETGLSPSLISDLENDDKKREVSYTKIATLAKHYGVSADYLLGLEEYHSSDPDIKNMVKYLGLSEDSLTNIHTHSQDVIIGNSVLDDLLSVDFTVMHRMLIQIFDYLNLRDMTIQRSLYDFFPDLEHEELDRRIREWGGYLLTNWSGKEYCLESAKNCLQVLVKSIEEKRRHRAMEGYNNGKYQED